MANQQVQNEQKKALIIGISDYTDSRLPPLDICKNDGRDLSKVLGEIGYNISDKNKLIGRAKIENLRKTINSFLKTGQPNEILLFYYSGHGVLDDEGDMYLASTETDADNPDSERCFPLNELTKLVRKSKSKVVVILDCCYSGSIQVAKGDEEAAAKLGRKAIVENSNLISQGQGKYILAASQAAQEALGPRTDKTKNSIFTSILLEGLKYNPKSVDNEGRVTPQSLSKYVYDEIIQKPVKQTPVLKTEQSGDVYLASYPELRKKTIETISAPLPDMNVKQSEPRWYRWYKSLELSKYQLLVPVAAVAIMVLVNAIPGALAEDTPPLTPGYHIWHGSRYAVCPPGVPAPCENYLPGDFNNKFLKIWGGVPEISGLWHS